MKKNLLNDDDLISISAAVKKAESYTSGEIATALIKESSDYAFFELRASVAFAVLLYIVQIQFYPGLDAYIGSFYWNSPSWITPMVIGMITLFGAGLFYFFSNIPLIDRFIIPNKIMESRVHSRALKHFVESGVYTTAQGTGILIFISFMEKRVEIIADRGISEKIPQEEWADIVSELTKSLAENNIVPGLIKAIESCGMKLKDHFPIAENDINELSDAIVILKE